jgi:hypothetical protein
MAAFAEKTGLSRETLCRTLSSSGIRAWDALALILEAFGLRLAVWPRSEVPRSTGRDTCDTYLIGSDVVPSQKIAL